MKCITNDTLEENSIGSNDEHRKIPKDYNPLPKSYENPLNQKGPKECSLFLRVLMNTLKTVRKQFCY